MAKPKTYPAITRALAHYEAALATLQETLCGVDRATLERIERAYSETPVATIPGAFDFQMGIHYGGDAFRAAKAVLDPDRALPSRAPRPEAKDAA